MYMNVKVEDARDNVNYVFNWQKTTTFHVYARDRRDRRAM